MRTKVRKWGNSLALRIPKPFAAEAEVKEGVVVDLSLEGGRLVVAPVTRSKYTLKQLLRKVSKDNLHEVSARRRGAELGHDAARHGDLF